ncbi:MAG: hypothetical protein C5S40_02735 [ANME-2 cluster archaeon]|nr:hypothetical protein [ANME-2 cluster archaeon]
MSEEEGEVRIGISMSCKAINCVVEAAENHLSMDMDGVGSSKEMDIWHSLMSEITEVVVVGNDVGTDMR